MTPPTKADRASIREWLAHWGDGPNWMDQSGVTVPIAKATVAGQLDALDAAEQLVAKTADRLRALEDNVQRNYGGGYHDKDMIDAYRHGMWTACNVVRHEVLPALDSALRGPTGGGDGGGA